MIGCPVPGFIVKVNVMNQFGKLEKTEKIRKTRLALKRVLNTVADAESLGCFIPSIDIDAANKHLSSSENVQLHKDIADMDTAEIIKNAGRIARIYASNK